MSPTITLVYEGPPKTDYEVDYITYNTWVTILGWVCLNLLTREETSC